MIFTQNKNKVTSHMWWPLNTLHAEELAGEKEMACCVRGYKVYEDMWAAAIGHVVIRKIVVVNYNCVKYSNFNSPRKCSIVYENRFIFMLTYQLHSIVQNAIKVTGSSLFVTLNCACTSTILYGL